MAKTIDYHLVVYVESDMLQKLLSYSLPSNIQLEDINTVDTFYNKYFLSNKQIMSNKNYQNKVPQDRKHDAAHWSSEYNLINHSKINFVKHSQLLFPEYEYYSWLDFGCIRNTLLDVPKCINFNKLTRSILYLAIDDPSKEYSPEDLIQSGKVLLTGSQFVVHRGLVSVFEELWDKKLEEWTQICIADDDQALVYRLYKENTHLFTIFRSSEGFSLFRNYLNKH